MAQSKQSQIKLLIAKGKEQGYLTFAEVNDHLPQDIVDSDQIEDIIRMINDMGIQVSESAPDNCGRRGVGLGPSHRAESRATRRRGGRWTLNLF